MKKIMLLFMPVFVLILFSATGAFAYSGTPSYGPNGLTVNVNFGSAAYSGIEGQVGSDIISKIGKYSYMPDLARGFGNADTYASDAATMRGYQGYDIFSLSVGSMVGLQAPSSSPTFY